MYTKPDEITSQRKHLRIYNNSYIHIIYPLNTYIDIYSSSSFHRHI